MSTQNTLHIAYIGGGSTGWAPALMNDLASEPDIKVVVSLYDIDKKGALRNEKFGNWVQTRLGVTSKVIYKAVNTIEESLKGADIVICSITPAPLRIMTYDVDLPRKYGIIQTVGDTVGPGGILRSMRAIPIYEGFARLFRKHCPKAWIVNYTNPMTVLTRTLTKVEPTLKTFGCCHEVFGTQHFLAKLAQDHLKLKTTIPRQHIKTNVLGINHFTWIDRAEYNGLDLLALLKKKMAAPGFRKKYNKAIIEKQLKAAKGEPWAVNNHEISCELFEQFGILGSAGDRHLAEFMPSSFIRSQEEMYRWGIVNTSVKFREAMVVKRQKDQAQRMADKKFLPKPSGEEGVKLIRAIMGDGDIVSNVNMENRGQMPDLPLGAVVETNALFSKDSVKPMVAGTLPQGVLGWVRRHSLNQELVVEGALKRDLHLCFQAFISDPMMTLSLDKAEELFAAMVKGTKAYLPDYR